MLSVCNIKNKIRFCEQVQIPQGDFLGKYAGVVGHFGEVNEGFKQLICSLAKVAVMVVDLLCC